MGRGWRVAAAATIGIVAGLALTPTVAQAASTPMVAWSPSGSFDYGSLDGALKQSSSHTFTLKNVDGKVAGPLTVSVSGASAFTKTADGCTGKSLKRGQMCNVSIGFAPTTIGALGAVLTAAGPKGAKASLNLTGVSAWQAADLTSYTQGQWDTAGKHPLTPGGTVLIDDFNSTYLSTGGVFVIGDTSKYVEEFGSGDALNTYLPQSGTPAALTGSLADPTSSSSGSFGGDVAALKLNVDFADAGYLGGSQLHFGDLTLCGLAVTGLNGMTVRQFLGTANTALGGTSTGYSTADLDAYAADLNASFENGATVSAFAHDHLSGNNLCNTVLWTTGSFTTYTQSDWHTGFSTLLHDWYNTIFISAGGVLTIGVAGVDCHTTTEYLIEFGSAQSVSDFLPQSGAPGVLTGCLADPTSSSAGAFAADVLALQLDVDFADAGYLTASSGLKFGDLTICGLTSDSDLNGQTIRQFLATANTALGAGGHVDSIADLDSISTEITGSFSIATPTDWAQAHLQPGTCP
jgi:hypothetical protein